MKGFISLHRKLMDNPIWSDPNYLKLWIYCLFEASHKERKQMVGNQIVTLERGQFITGRFALAEDLNKGVKPKQRLDKLTWWRYLNNLQIYEMLNIKSTNKYSVVTIVNYDTYQNVFNQTEHNSEQQLNINRTSNEQQLNTNNNVNNLNNVNNKRKEEGTRVTEDPIMKFLRENNILHPGGITKTHREDLDDVILNFGFENPEQMIKEAVKDAVRGNGRTWKFVYNKLNLWRKLGIKNSQELEFHNQKANQKPFYQKPQRQEVVPEWFKDRKKQSNNLPNESETSSDEVAAILEQYKSAGGS